jgi:hypothetical protein
MPLGWDFFLYRIDDNAAAFNVDEIGRRTPGELLGNWQAGIDGASWLTPLIQQKLAVSLTGNGYPCAWLSTVEPIRQYVVRDLRPQQSVASKPQPNTVQVHRLLSLAASEILFIEAWDRS